MAKPTNIHQALFQAQAAMPDIQKNALNPHFKNRYVTLEELLDKVLPVLHEHDILLTQFVSNVDGAPALTTRFTFVGEGGGFVEDIAPLVLDKHTPQAVGSAITYMRRYALMAALGLTADEDDDAEAATSKPVKKSQDSASKGWSEGY